MKKGTKHVRHICRVKNVEYEDIEDLYRNINHPCRECIHDCKNMIENTKECQNRVVGYDLNTLIDMINEENVNLRRFVEDYNLKLRILLSMLRAEMEMSYKYYCCICHRVRLTDEYEKYKERFMNEEDYEKNTSESEVVEI